MLKCMLHTLSLPELHSKEQKYMLTTLLQTASCCTTTSLWYPQVAEVIFTLLKLYSSIAAMFSFLASISLDSMKIVIHMS